MKREEEIKATTQLGRLMVDLGTDQDWKGFSTGTTEQDYQKIQAIIGRQFVLNGWFTRENVLLSLRSLGALLTEDNLSTWLSNYQYSAKPRKVGVIMAGNLPLVGFHDFICVLLAGHKVVCKLSSDDSTLLPALAEQLIHYCPTLKDRISFSAGKLGEIDAIIATGSDNSTVYFEQYFGKYPHIFRRNRTSVAVLTGDESKEELALLGKDIFTYFGLGCRNVSHLLLPKGFQLSRFFEAIVDFHPIVNHHKYANNYDYNKAVYLMNLMELLDNNFVLLRESEDLFSPLAMIHYNYYESPLEIEDYLQKHKEQIQVIVGRNYLHFGEAQQPSLMDYADGIDTMKWLNSL